MSGVFSIENILICVMGLFLIREAVRTYYVLRINSIIERNAKENVSRLWKKPEFETEEEIEDNEFAMWIWNKDMINDKMRGMRDVIRKRNGCAIPNIGVIKLKEIYESIKA